MLYSSRLPIRCPTSCTGAWATAAAWPGCCTVSGTNQLLEFSAGHTHAPECAVTAFEPPFRLTLKRTGTVRVGLVSLYALSQAALMLPLQVVMAEGSRAAARASPLAA